MKITSHYRGNRAELVNDGISIRLGLNEIVISQNRHYNGNEKFYEIRFDPKDIDKICKQMFGIPKGKKSKLVRLAEYIDTLINKLRG